MKVIPHGIFARYGAFEIEADTVADAVEGWSRQVSGLDEDFTFRRPLMSIVGFDSEEAIYGKTDVKEIHLVPSMYGGGGAFKSILIGVALIGLSFIPGIGQAVQIALLSAGIGMALQGVMQMFMKTPTVSKSDDPDPSKYLGAGDNTTEIGTLIPKGYGRMLLGGQYLSVQVNSNDMVYGTFPSTVPA